MLSSRKLHDVKCIIQEAQRVGFVIPEEFLGEHDCNYLRHFYVKVNDNNLFHAPEMWVFSDEFGICHDITPSVVEKLGLTETQLEFLNWSRNWTGDILKFWKSIIPECEKIEDFIVYLKQTSKVIYYYPGTFTKNKEIE